MYLPPSPDSMTAPSRFLPRLFSHPPFLLPASRTFTIEENGQEVSVTRYREITGLDPHTSYIRTKADTLKPGFNYKITYTEYILISRQRAGKKKYCTRQISVLKQSLGIIKRSRTILDLRSLGLQHPYKLRPLKIFLLICLNNFLQRY